MLPADPDHLVRARDRRLWVGVGGGSAHNSFMPCFRENGQRPLSGLPVLPLPFGSFRIPGKTPEGPLQESGIVGGRAMPGPRVSNRNPTGKGRIGNEEFGILSAIPAIHNSAFSRGAGGGRTPHGHVGPGEWCVFALLDLP